MNTRSYQKTFVTIAITLLIVPQLAFASWWNPFSWSIFSFLFDREPKAETVVLPSSNVVATSSWEASLTDTTTTTLTEEKPKLDAGLTETPTKVLPSVPAKTPPLVVQPPSQIAQPTGTLCNGTYWNACPIGQKLTCPTSGDAYCDVPQVITEPLPQIDNDQFCKDSYGNRSIWDASITNCACESGYLFNAESNSCVSTYLYCKSSYGDNAIWDESRYGCACKSGYEPSSNNQSCVYIKTESQTQQSNSTIDSSVCQAAIDSLTKFQKQYEGAIAGARSTGSSVVANGNVQRLTNEYNLKLPTYQIAVQTACQ